jgi:hypothetical protein
MRKTTLSLALFSVLVIGCPGAGAAGGAADLEGARGHALPAGPASGTATAADALEAGPATQEPGVRCDGSGPCTELETQLPLRVLPRPLSHVYKDRREAPDGIEQSNVKAFHPLYVYAREGIDVSDPANPKGW